MEYAGARGCSATTPLRLSQSIALIRIASSNLARSTMYKVSKIIHKKYGNVIEITKGDEGTLNPETALFEAKFARRIWLEKGEGKVKFLIDNQALTPKQAETWAIEEYKSLPKCGWCGKILKEDIFTHTLCKENLYCSQSCADKDYVYQVDKLKDEEDIEYL
jgi:hypothetical protein